MSQLRQAWRKSSWCTQDMACVCDQAALGAHMAEGHATYELCHDRLLPLQCCAHDSACTGGDSASGERDKAQLMIEHAQRALCASDRRPSACNLTTLGE